VQLRICEFARGIAFVILEELDGHSCASVRRWPAQGYEQAVRRNDALLIGPRKWR
jgi:hypothetical protein